MESPSLEIFQPCLEAVLCNLLWVTLLRQGVGLGDPQRFLPTPAMPEFCDSVKQLPFRNGECFHGTNRKVARVRVSKNIQQDFG